MERMIIIMKKWKQVWLKKWLQGNVENIVMI